MRSFNTHRVIFFVVIVPILLSPGPLSAQDAAPLASISVDAKCEASPLHERWEINFPSGLTLDEYAKILSSFGIELGIYEAGKVTYVSNFTKNPPDVRHAPSKDEKRLYMVWREGALKEADQDLVKRAGVAAAKKIVLQFYPQATEQRLLKIEREHRQVDAAKIRKTRFAVKLGPTGYEFYVVDQSLLDEFECRRASGEIHVDGLADEAAWAAAQAIDNFSLPWLGKAARPARTATTARLLWDQDFLYFFAAMDDADLYADVEEHDGLIWENDVFELFLKPDCEKPGYYEFQVNAAGAVLDMFLPRRGSGGYRRFKNDGEFHVDAKVVLRGTLNHWQDHDDGWSVEGRIAWNDFSRTGGRPAEDETWRLALCRYDYSVEFEGPELSTCAPLRSKPADFHHHEDYAVLRFVGAKHVP